MTRLTRSSIAFSIIVLLAFPLAGQQLTLLGDIDLGGGTDVWGYVDSTGTEYAIVGGWAGISIVNLSDPTNPTLSSTVSAPGFDHKVWSHYVYAVTGGPGTDQGKIIDISDPDNASVVASFQSSHNLFITDDGIMIAEFSSPLLVIYDLNPDPLNPTEIWSGGVEGHDASVIGDIMYDFHGSAGTNIYDVSDFSNPQLLGTINDPTIAYHHHGYTDATGDFLYICDELASSAADDITIWDISDYENPERVGGFRDENAVVHNLYVVGEYAFVSYYSAGLRVYDISQPDTLALVAEDNSIGSTWGVYPFLPSGVILASGGIGLSVFEFEANPTGIDVPIPALPTEFSLSQNYPNPFNPSTKITLQLPVRSSISLTVYDISGRLIRSLANNDASAGTHRFEWDGTNVAGQAVTSGVYFYQLNATTENGEQFSETRKMMLTR